MLIGKEKKSNMGPTLEFYFKSDIQFSREWVVNFIDQDRFKLSNGWHCRIHQAWSLNTTNTHTSNRLYLSVALKLQLELERTLRK